jgi:hypothetical protein
MILKAHISFGDDNETLDTSTISNTSKVFTDDVQVGKQIQYDNEDSTSFTGKIIGFDSIDGRTMYVQIGDEFTVIDAFCHGTFIVKVW